MTLISARTRKQFDDTLKCQISRFLEELPSDDLHKRGINEADDGVANKAKGTQTLKSLRGLFDQTGQRYFN